MQYFIRHMSIDADSVKTEKGKEHVEGHLLHFISLCTLSILYECVFVWRSAGLLWFRSSPPTVTLTDKEDGKSNEEEEDVWHHIERVQETAVVQNPSVHVVGHRVILAPTECQGHGGTGTLQETGRRTRGEDQREKERRGERQRDLEEKLSVHVVYSKGKTDGSSVDPSNSQSDLLPAPSQIKRPNIRSSD